MALEVVRHSTREQRRSLAAWAVAVVALVGLYVAVYPSVGANSSYAKVIDQMPKAYRALFTVSSGADFTSPIGYLDTELFSFLGPVVVLLYAVGRGAAAIAGEEDRHTLELLLANPVARWRLVAEKFAATLVGLAALMLVLWLGLVVEGRAAGMSVPVVDGLAAVVHLGLLGAEFGAVALLVGCLTGSVAASRAVPATLAVAAYLVNSLGQVVGWMRPLRPLSPFYEYSGHDPLRNGFWPVGLAVMALTTAVVVAAAARAFARRDVRV